MALTRHEIPILEYDDTYGAVITPFQKTLNPLPSCAVFPFLGEEINRFAKEHSCECICELDSATKPFPIYRHYHLGHEICLCQAPVGAPAATQILDFLIGNGVKNIISAGSCGALMHYPENVFLIPTEALRCEGTSYHYLPPTRTVAPDTAATEAIRQVMRERGIPFEDCKTWTTDGFYRETEKLVEYRKAEGFSVVEMECAALFACARFRHARIGQLLYTADSLANTDAYDARDWGRASVSIALQICLDAAIKLDKRENEEK